jgi:hypothetical protein
MALAGLCGTGIADDLTGKAGAVALPRSDVFTKTQRHRRPAADLGRNAAR